MEKKLNGGLNALLDFEKRCAGAWIEGWRSYWEIVANLAGNPRKAPAAYGQLVEAGARYYRTVLDSSVELAERFYPNAPESDCRPEPIQDAEVAAAGSTRQAAAPEKPRAGMLFEGPGGSLAARQFVVANKTALPLEVSFELSDLISDEGERSRLEAELIPASFSFEPGEERAVECRVPVSSSLIEGREYRAILRAIGMPDLQVILCVKRLSEPIGLSQ